MSRLDQRDGARRTPGSPEGERLLTDKSSPGKKVRCSIRRGGRPGPAAARHALRRMFQNTGKPFTIPSRLSR